jgi:RNA polymerase sigma-70 factor (ECF subfamily)
MVHSPQQAALAAVESVYRTQSRRVFATLIRLLGGDFDLAEEAMHEAFAAATEQWPVEGVPQQPRAWLVAIGRRKAIDAMRRRARFDASLTDLARRLDDAAPDPDADEVADDRLRLIFTCCHPDLPPTVQVALTLREVCGLTTEQVASAFLTTPATLAQRIVRGKARIREEGIPYEVPGREQLPARLDAVLAVIYLVFNEGYSASSGAALTRSDLSAEAIRLGRLLVELLPDAEAIGLLALMLLHDSRREARADAAGDLVLLEHQDRSRWSRAQIDEGRQLVARALEAGPVGVYTVQAAISAVHAQAPRADQTDWGQIVRWYDVLLTVQATEVVALNRAVAVAMRDGPEAGLALIDAILGQGKLVDYHLAHAARADLLRRLGRRDEARAAYAKALGLARQDPERRFLERRLAELSDAS